MTLLLTAAQQPAWMSDDVLHPQSCGAGLQHTFELKDAQDVLHVVAQLLTVGLVGLGSRRHVREIPNGACSATRQLVSRGPPETVSMIVTREMRVDRTAQSSSQS